MNTLAFPTATKSATTFELIPNTIKVGGNRIFLFYIMVLFPLLITSAIFYNAFELRGTTLLAACIISLVVLANIYFFYIRSKTQSKHVTLSFEFGEITLSQNGQVLNSVELEDIEYKQLNWGMDESLPAIQITGKGFPKLCIGYTKSSLSWSEMETTKDCTDFLVSSENEWKQLLKVLAKAK